MERHKPIPQPSFPCCIRTLKTHRCLNTLHPNPRDEFRTFWGRVEELLVAKELWNDHKKLIFFPFSSAATCTNRPLEIDQRLHALHTPKPLAFTHSTHGPLLLRTTIQHTRPACFAWEPQLQQTLVRTRSPSSIAWVRSAICRPAASSPICAQLAWLLLQIAQDSIARAQPAVPLLRPHPAHSQQMHSRSLHKLPAASDEKKKD
ncbi:hypothetical protein Taro_030430 [Colocasia esculenta]|uniref:Uncharacterized protein n=1 Tax=Colocasia esculenta TaxID=4460 RepID=A0A843W075_COLES|nr:hypothetical protein [Colocasia esculenta]